VVKEEKKEEKTKQAEINNALGLIHNKLHLTTLEIWKQQKVLKTII
jgi:hypothetical protein